MGSATEQRTEARKEDSKGVEDVSRLRSLILGDDYERTIRHWQNADETQRVAEVLAEAIRLRSQQDKSVQNALARAIDDVLDASIRRDPVKLAHVISPIIGPSIRNAVRTALTEMVESLNQILDRSISPRSLVWRIQAWRAGVPFGEFVLLRTLQYRVEQVLIIHRETGILLQSEVAPNVKMRDPDLVSAMLSAINGFVSDSFQSGDDAADIQQVRFGERLLLIDVGTQAIIAAVVQGDPPARVASQLKTTLEQFHRIFAQPLAAFRGDRSAFAAASSLLQDCISEKFQAENTPRKPWLALSVIGLMVAGVLVLGWQRWDIARQQEAILRQITASGDYLLLDAQRSGKQLNLHVLTRFGAPPPDDRLTLPENSDIELSIQSTPVSMNPEDVLLPYLVRRYALDSQVSVQLVQNVLTVSGKLTQTQMEQIRADHWVRGLVSTIDDAAVEWVTPPNQRTLDEARWRTLVDELQRTRFYFAANVSVLDADEVTKITQTLQRIADLVALQSSLGVDRMQIVITGYADTTGNDALNARLSRDRAQRVREILIDNQIEPDLLISMGVGSLGNSRLEAGQKRFAALQVIY